MGDVQGKAFFQTLFVENVFDNGADINAKLDDGKTALHRACEGGQLEVVQLLLSRGADVNMKTTQGFTGLQIAAEGSRLEIVWFLVRQYPSLVLEKTE